MSATPTNWDERASVPGLHAVLSRRWSPDECAAVDRAEQELLAGRLPDRLTAPLLDLGCGIGRLTAALGRRAPAVVSLDRSLAMLRRGRNLIQRPVQADAALLPFAAGSFGAVVTSGVLQHIMTDADFGRALREIGRVLRDGGTALFVEGLGTPADPAAGASATRVRTLPDYAAALSPQLRLRERASFVRVQDPYALMVWDKAGR